eukprot:gene40714-50372_t
MGLQPASSYFQYCMTTIVLAGLMYEICERLRRVEWVGHQIDADGMHFTPDKLNE